MLPDFTTYLDDPRAQLTNGGQILQYRDCDYPVTDGIVRLISDVSYSKGNFSKLREEHSTLQLDSKNGTNDRHATMLERSGWPREFFRNKTVLECGCGAGPDTEVLLDYGARVVAVDLAIDVARRNIGDHDRVSFVQGSIANLPFRPQSFDIVWCHRVIQHTPAPRQILEHILSFVREDGGVFVHSYARSMLQMFRWKYPLRPFTKRISPERLYRFIQWYSEPAFHLTNWLRRIPFGPGINHVFIPFLNFRHVDKFADLSNAQIIEYGIHDTFDALSPRYDRPLKHKTMYQIASAKLVQPFEVVDRPGVTLLRTRID